MTQRDAYQLKRHLDLGKPSPGEPQSAQQSQTQVLSPAARPQVPRGDVTHCLYIAYIRHICRHICCATTVLGQPRQH